MPRYHWHFDAGGLPIERIDTLTGEHVPVFTGQPGQHQGSERPLACCFPQVKCMTIGDWRPRPAS